MNEVKPRMVMKQMLVEFCIGIAYIPLLVIAILTYPVWKIVALVINWYKAVEIELKNKKR